MIRKGVLGLLLFCVGLIITGSYVLVFTQGGLRACVYLAEKFSPGILSVGSVHGRLLDDFKLGGVRYSDSFGTVSLHDISISWHPHDLLHRKVSVSALQVSDMVLEISSQSEEVANTDDPAASFANFALPVSVHVQKGSIGPLTFITGEEQQKTEYSSIVLEDLSGAGNRFKFEKLSIVSESLHLDAEGEVLVTDIPSTDLKIDLSMNFEGMPTMTGGIALKGTMEQLGYEVLLSAPSAAVAKGTLFDVAENLHWDVVLSTEELPLTKIDETWPDIVLAGLKLSGKGDAASYSIYGGATGSYDAFTDIAVAVEIKGDVNALRFEHVQLRRQEMELQGFGSFSWNDGIAWQVQLAGNDIDAGLFDPSWTGRFGLDAEIKGDERAVQFENVQLRSQEMVLNGVGFLSWNDGIAWQLKLSGNDIDPGLFDPQWPGRFGFEAETTGQEKNGKITADIDLQQLAGELRGYPLSAAANVAIDGNSVNIEKFYVKSADSVLEVAGSSEESMNMEFSLNSSDLGSVWPDLSGSLMITGQVRGNREKPEVDFDITGSEIHYEEASLGRLTGSGNGVLEPKGSVTVSLAADEIIIGENTFETVAVAVQGQLEKHVLDLTVTGPEASATVSLDGGYADQRWQGNVSRGDVRSGITGTWRLREPAALHLSQSDMDIQKLCLVQGSSSVICINGSYSTEAWNMNTTIDSLPFSLFKDLQSNFEEMSGVVSGTVSAEGKGANLAKGELLLSTDGFSSRFVMADDIAQLVTVTSSSLHIDTDGRDFNVQLQGILEDDSRISVDGVLNGINISPWDIDNPGFAGKVAFNIIDLSPLGMLIHPIAEPFGTLVGDIDVDGKLKQPQLSGKVRLDNGRLIFPGQGITVENLTLQIDGLMDRLKVKLAGASGGGTISADGFLPLSFDGSEPVILQVSGDNFEIMNSSEMKVRVSPELQLKIGKTNRDLSGRVLLTEAFFAPRFLQGAVLPSEDVVFVHGDEKDVEATLPFHVDITIVAGEKVQISTFGLKGLIGGQLHIVSVPFKPIVLEGNLNILKGTYSVYGRQLNIVRGYLLYNGNPPENPGIDIRAENSSAGVTTGIEVSGFLQEPEIGFYSTPAMDKDEIIRRLLLNTTLVGSSDDEGFLESVTSDTGIDPITSAIVGVKESLRLDDIKIESGKESEDLSLVIGSWLTPKLYVSYGQNLLKESGSFNTKYILGYGFSVETESGTTDSGVDLMYEIDR